MIILTTALILSIISNIISYILLNKGRKLSDKLNEDIKAFPKKIKDEVKLALDKQRNVIKGQLSEQLTPFMKGFPYSPSDLKFFGNGFDYICVSNMTEARETDTSIDEIIFIDIKTGKSRLSNIQKKIRDAIVEGRVYWETITIDNNDVVKINRASKKDKKCLLNTTLLEENLED